MSHRNAIPKHIWCLRVTMDERTWIKSVLSARRDIAKAKPPSEVRAPILKPNGTLLTGLKRSAVSP